MRILQTILESDFGATAIGYMALRNQGDKVPVHSLIFPFPCSPTQLHFRPPLHFPCPAADVDRSASNSQLQGERSVKIVYNIKCFDVQFYTPLLAFKFWRIHAPPFYIFLRTCMLIYVSSNDATVNKSIQV